MILSAEHGEFILHIAGKTYRDAIILSKAWVDRITGEVRVEAYLSPKHDNGVNT